MVHFDSLTLFARFALPFVWILTWNYHKGKARKLDDQSCEEIMLNDTVVAVVVQEANSVIQRRNMEYFMSLAFFIPTWLGSISVKTKMDWCVLAYTGEFFSTVHSFVLAPPTISVFSRGKSLWGNFTQSTLTIKDTSRMLFEPIMCMLCTNYDC